MFIPNVKLLLWRIIWDNLPITMNLHKQYIILNASCPRRGEVNETVIHAFNACLVIANVISIWQLTSLNVNATNRKFNLWIKRNITISNDDFHLAKPPIQFIFGILIWKLWHQCNDVIS